ncbi:hypothetical protein mRhiFer1_009884 [Rhinolophus ferrumequinum]|uniref:Uncharacterized protein n=1 Tax=Rhinolophus ferrumequinum TaxID=59479 RepID=A0A7J7YSZ8_RHIFE|nr:hypothetical protein mRhiFer1_009884 [Rhinolophus ferrumequinum]
MALVDTKVVKEAMEGLETLVETVVAPAVEVEAKRSDVVTSGAVVGPEDEVEASVPPEAVEENRVGTDAAKETVVLVLPVAMLVSDLVVTAMVVSVPVVDKDSAIFSETMVEAVLGTDTVVGVSLAVVVAVKVSRPTVVSEAQRPV